MLTLPHRSALALWPLSRRQRWGLLSAALEAAEVPWPESERLAYERCLAEPDGAPVDAEPPAPAPPVAVARQSDWLGGADRSGGTLGGLRGKGAGK